MFGLIQYTILDLTMGKFRAQGVHQTGQQSIVVEMTLNMAK